MPMLVTAIETLRLIIRDARASDAEAFHAYMQREQYWHDLPIDPPNSRVDCIYGRHLRSGTDEGTPNRLLYGSDR
jgi:hypothetical protein